jgi:acyl carrier protein
MADLERTLQGGEGASNATPMEAATLEKEIKDLVRSYIGDDVSPDEPLNKQGLDSLAAMELRQKLQA